MNADDIVEVLEELDGENIQVHTDNVQVSCPLAPWTHETGGDRSGSFGIRIEPYGASKCHCFACGFKSLSMVPLIEKLQMFQVGEVDLDDLTERVAKLEEEDIRRGVDFDDPWAARERSSEVVHPEVYLRPFRGTYHDYILSRGFSGATLRTWEIGFDEDLQRVIFPVRNRTGGLVGAVGRRVRDNNSRKYHNYWKFPKGRYLYGAHLVPEDQSKVKAVVAVEGPTDVLRTWQEVTDAGLEGLYPVGFLGADPTRMQAQALAELSDQVVLFGDNDKAGRSLNARLATMLAEHSVTATYVTYPKKAAGDPDGLGEMLVSMLKERRLYVA